MRVAAACLLLWLASARAQTPSVEEFISRLNTDLVPLTSGSVADDDLQKNVSRAFREDIVKFESQRNLEMKQEAAVSPLDVVPFFSIKSARKLIAVLVGKDLSEATLTSFNSALLAMVESAVVCRNTHASLKGARGFQTAAEQAYKALGAMGVKEPELEAVVDDLLAKALAVSRPPPFQPVYK